MIRYRPRNFILSRREQRRGGKRKEKKKRKKFRSRMLGLLLIKAIRGFHGVPFSLSLSLSMGRGRAERRRRRGGRRKGGGERFGVSREDHRPIICFDMIFRVFALASLAEWAFKLPREIKLLRVSSRYYTHAPPIESPPLPALLYPF